MRNPRYIDYWVRRKCFRDFLNALDGHADTKEWTECVGMMNRIKAALSDMEPPDVVFDIGCGKRPTLGVMVALNIKSVGRVICVDPQLDVKYAENINGISLNAMTVKDFVECAPLSFKNALIACNHGHVSVSELRLLFDCCDDWTYITCPCCVDNRLKSGSYFRDDKVWSPKNKHYTFRKAGNTR